MRQSLLVLLLVGLASAQKYNEAQQAQQQQQEEEEGSSGLQPLNPSVPEPPSQIPETSFVCEGKPYDPGMYADEETGCRVYHMCFRGRKEDFICGTGTIFNQETLTCDYPANVECGASSQFYDSNSEFGKGAPEPSGDEGAKPAARQPPAPRPAGPRPPPASRPPPATRPRQPPSKANPRPVTQPQPRPSRPTPRKDNPRPARPTPFIQQDQQNQQEEVQNVDYQYEPSNQFQRRSGLPARSAVPAASVPSPVRGRRGQAAFRPMSQRWQMMSANY